MSDLLNQISHLNTLNFEDAKNMAAYAGMAVLPASVAVFGVDYFRNPRSSAQGMAGAEIDTLEQVSQIREGRFKSRLARWGAPILLAAGASTLSVNMLEPTLEYETTLPDTEAVFVVDGSDSMYYTDDMSGAIDNRLESSVSVLNNSLGMLPEDMSIGIYGFGETYSQIRPLEVSRDELTLDELTDGIATKGSGNLTSALNAANIALDSSSNEGTESVVILTDGTIEDIEAANQKIEEMSEDGKNVLVALTGTEDGTYKRSEFDTRDYGSAVQGEQFAGLDDLEGVTVIETDNPEEITVAIDDFIDKSTEDTERRPTSLFTMAGAGLIAAGVLQSIYRTWKRK